MKIVKLSTSILFAGILCLGTLATSLLCLRAPAEQPNPAVDKKDRVKNFTASCAFNPNILFVDPVLRDAKLRDVNEPQLPGNATYKKGAVKFTVPKGKTINIRMDLQGVKALSVFLSMTDDPRYLQFYKGEAGSTASTALHHYDSDQLGYDQEYVLTSASKDTPGRESGQPWWNNHPLGKPRTDVHKKKTIWEADDSRNPGTFGNVKVTWFHPDYDPMFQYIEPD